MDDLYSDYDPLTLSGRIKQTPNTDLTRRITLPLPDDLKMAFPPGVPKYDPSAMPHARFHEFQLKHTYVLPLSCYVLHALQPYYASISPLEEPLESKVLVAGERVSIVDCLLPHAKHSIEYVDPATWAILIQIFDTLPERFSKYNLALNDPHLSTLASIRNTPNFSVVTFLDLSGSKELLDENISFLKVLSSLCVFDASRTRLTDQGVKNFKSTLFLREPGPVYLRSWSLRMCEGVTAKVLGSLLSFPLLSVLDLRETSVLPSQLRVFWSQNTLLPALDNVEYFAPNPQHKIPELLQRLESSSFLHPPNDSKTKAPYVIHVDRVRPEPLVHHRTPRTNDFSRIGKNAYHVSASYTQPPDREEPCWPNYNSRPYYSEDSCDDGYYDQYESDWPAGSISSDEGFSDSESLQMEREEISDDSGSSSSSQQSPSVTQVPDTASSVLQPSSPISALSPQSSPTPTSTNSIPPDSLVLAYDDSSSLVQANGLTANSNPYEHSPNPVALPTLLDDSGSSDDELGSSVPESALGLESGLNTAQSIPGFFNSRAQAGLAPPKRRRMKRYSSESSRNYDSEEECKRRRMEFSDFGDVELALFRNPPPWATAQRLIDAKQKATVSAGLRSLGQDGRDTTAQSSVQLAKTKKAKANGALTAWNLILASSSKQCVTPSSTSRLTATSLSPAVCSGQSAPLATPPQPPQVKDKPARRTTIGRPPKDPGTVVWKLK